MTEHCHEDIYKLSASRLQHQNVKASNQHPYYMDLNMKYMFKML